MSNPLQQTIEALAKEKGIEPDVVISAIEEAVATASRKYYKTGENLKTRFNMETGQVDLFALKTVVRTSPRSDRDRYRHRPLDVPRALRRRRRQRHRARRRDGVPKPTEVLGRIAAQTAKQVIFQKVREAERENIFAEYNQRIGEVVNGTIKRFENGDIILEVGRIEAVLPRKEQSRAESYAPGDRVRTVIKGVNRSAKGPQIVLSRTDPALLIKLFEQEVPEIYDGTVMIRGAVREAGDRAKVAVMSRERDVDPVGACVGMKGTRVQSIIRELRGEKIDIVEYSDDPIAFVTNALSPAKVQRVSIVDDGERVMEVVVEDKQLSLGDRQEGPERPARGQADRLAHRHQERRRKAPRGRGAVRRARGRAGDGGDARDRRRIVAEAGRRRDGGQAAVQAEATPALRARGYRRENRPQARRRGLAMAAGHAQPRRQPPMSEVPGVGGKTAEKILAAARGETPAEQPQE